MNKYGVVYLIKNRVTGAKFLRPDVNVSLLLLFPRLSSGRVWKIICSTSRIRPCTSPTVTTVTHSGTLFVSVTYLLTYLHTYLPLSFPHF